MPVQTNPVVTLNAEIRVPLATTQLVRFHATQPADNILREEETYWIDLCLTPRPPNARACFVDRWSPHRFERLGELFVLPPRERMHARSDAGAPQTSVLCHLHPEALREWFGDELDWSDQRIEAGLDVSEAGVRQLLRRIGEELRQPGFASATLVELMVAQLAIELARCSSKTEDRGGLAPWRLRLIDDRLREAREAPTLGELAALVSLSIRQLTRAFRVSRGRSIGEHVTQCRIEHAKRLLAGEESVKAIAVRLGFGSASSFSFAFRGATGQTPREFRARTSGRAADGG